MSGQLIACLYVFALCFINSESLRFPSSALIRSSSSVLRARCLDPLHRESFDSRDCRLARLISEQERKDEHDRAERAGEGVIRSLERPLAAFLRGVDTSKAGLSNVGALERADCVERTEVVERAGDGAAEPCREFRRDPFREDAHEELRE